MSYTTFAEISSDFKDTTFAATGNVKDAEVTQFIVEADALINSYIGKVYVLPVTPACEGLQLLKMLSRSLVVQRVKGIMEVRQMVITEANQEIIAQYFTVRQVMKILESLRDKEQTLVGAELLAGTSGFYSKNYADDVEPVIKKDERQW